MVRDFAGHVIPALCDTRCIACGLKRYTLPNGRCDGCQYHNDPIMRAWVVRALGVKNANR